MQGRWLSVANEAGRAGENLAHVHALSVDEEGVCLHRNVVFQLGLVDHQHLQSITGFLQTLL